MNVFRVPKVRWLQEISVLQWTLTFLFLGFVCVVVFFLLLFTPFVYLPVLYLVWFLHDFRTPERGGRRSNWVRNWKVWEYSRQYFPIRLVKTADLDPSRNYIFLYHPHGTMSYGAFHSFLTTAGKFEETFPGLRSILLVLNILFVSPFYREYIMALGACSCSRRSIEWLLEKEGTGNAVVLVVGGASEALEARPGSFTLTLANRKGFCRIALKHGTTLVPVFAFGENDLYNQMPNPPGSLLRKFQTFVLKHLSYIVPAMYGRGIILPHRKPINVVVGSPLPTTCINEPTNEEVNELHGRYIRHLTELFETNKAKYGVHESQHLKFI